MMGHAERRNAWRRANPEYNSWSMMKTRCLNPSEPRRWAAYGGRGIRLCERWMKYENFLADVGHRPFAGATLERIDNDGNYEPGNVRWASRKEQARNRRSSRVFLVGGKAVSMVEAAELTGIPYHRLQRGQYA
jgi:hypothetical protein